MKGKANKEKASKNELYPVNFKQYMLIALAVVAIDQITKTLVRQSLPLHEPLWLLKPLLFLTHTTNTGASFGMLQNANGVLIWVSLIALGFLTYKLDNIPTNLHFACALIAGGIIGNFADRVIFGMVTDFIDFQIWPVFNAADSAMCIGTAIVIILSLKQKDRISKNS